MKIIGRADIVGARITAIHCKHEEVDGYNCTITYFTVDRGFTFSLPCPGHEWEAVELPAKAEALPDEYWETSSRLVWPFKFERTKVDTVKRIKERTIAGVYCPKPERASNFCDPDAACLVFDDGSSLSCAMVAPEGIPTGFSYQTDLRNRLKLDELVDFFDIPFTA